ncbi:MAG: DUF3108 domain-containing protein, partial [Ekhidna sp.]|nr:DUF3108 domain-containing protein [Ekhidna sp.]
SLRDLSEGNWDLEEHSYFDYDSMQIVVKSSSKKDKEERPDKIFELESDNVFDLMGGVMLARSLDYKAMQPGEEISLNAFFEDKFYDFNMIFSGREMISTKVGDIYCFKVQPVLPDNSIFKGEDAISFWVSADANRLPLKIEADMNFGKAFVELTAYKNVKSGIDFQ